MRPTIRDVAAHAGVSLKTVSRVIDSETGVADATAARGVADATAARVVAAIDELGFRRNDLARSLRQGRTSSTLGLVMGSRDAGEAETVAAELLNLPADRRPTALFAADNRNTVGALRAVQRAGRAVALVEFDDFELAVWSARP